MKLTVDTVTFGKHKGSTLQTLLKDRQYCGYLLSQDWFKESYTYLHARIEEHRPLDYFLHQVEEEDKSAELVFRYRPFLLKTVEDVRESSLCLTPEELQCYAWYREAVSKLRDKVKDRVRLGVSDPYNIKAPPKYLQKFEEETGLKREALKEFQASYDLRGITSIVEDMKKEAGIDFKATKGFIIAKERSDKQEKFWSKVLKNYYKEHVSEQFKLDNCKFDFINIRTNTIFEAKLGFKDFNEKQYLKYKLILDRFKLVYLIGETTLIDLSKGVIYTTDYASVIEHQVNIPLSEKSTYLDEMIFDFEIEPVTAVEEALALL